MSADTTDESKRVVLAFLAREADESGIPPSSPATDDAIHEFESRNGILVPAELRGWLLVHNGALAGEGGIYGIRPGSTTIDMESWYSWAPGWQQAGWIPVAGDGCGDVYVLDTSVRLGDTHPVYFVDQAEIEQPAYVVASGLWRFLWLMLSGEALGRSGQKRYWPFDRDRVLQEDPLLASWSGPVPLPWEVADEPLG